MSIARIKDAVDLRELAREWFPTKQHGQDALALCPFHKEDTPSFRIHRTWYKCFGCQASGDAFTFISKIEGISLGAAMRQLSDRTGIALADYKPMSRVQRAVAQEDIEFCEWWRRRRVTYEGKRLGAYVRQACREAIGIGHGLKALREMDVPALRQYVAREATLEERAEWRADKHDAEWWAGFMVEACAMSVEMGTRQDLEGSRRYEAAAEVRP